MIESGLVALLRANAPIAALVANRIYAVLVPPNTVYPCLSYTTMSKPPEVALDRSASEVKRIQIDCWGKSYADAKALQSALHVLLDGYRGTLPDATVVDLCTRDIEADYWESDSEVFRAMSEYLLTYPSGQ